MLPPILLKVLNNTRVFLLQNYAQDFTVPLYCYFLLKKPYWKIDFLAFHRGSLQLQTKDGLSTLVLACFYACTIGRWHNESKASIEVLDLNFYASKLSQVIFFYLQLSIEHIDCVSRLVFLQGAEFSGG